MKFNKKSVIRRALPIPLMLYGYMVSFILVSCTAGLKDEKIIEKAGEIIRKVTSEYLADDRINVFRVEYHFQDQQLILKGETDLPDAKNALFGKLDSAGIKYIDSLVMLPSDRSVSKTFALVNHSVANLRKNPSHSSELVSQVLLGTPLKILSSKGGWYLVRCPDKYLGWIEEEEIVLMTENAFNDYKVSEKIIFTALYGTLQAGISVNSPQVSDLVAGDIMQLSGSQGGFYHAILPDGRSGYVSAGSSKPFDLFILEKEPEGKELVITAESMLGIPYLWGGTSVKAMDCSGFTKTVFSLNGINLPRDADQQALIGESIDEDRNFNLLQPGDLLFFGRKSVDGKGPAVTHVGMWIGGMQYIHSSGRVRISSMDSLSEDFGRYNYNRYIKSTRVAGNISRNDFLDPDLILY